jgi:hypothetical protein
LMIAYDKYNRVVEIDLMGKALDIIFPPNYCG